MNDRSAARIRGLRANALAATVMLLIQYCFGIAVGLYSVLPVSDHGKDLFGAFGAAVANGPVLLTLHAVLGTLLTRYRPCCGHPLLAGRCQAGHRAGDHDILRSSSPGSPARGSSGTSTTARR